MLEDLLSWTGGGELERRETRDKSVLDEEIKERKLSKGKSFITDRDNSTMWVPLIGYIYKIVIVTQFS